MATADRSRDPEAAAALRQPREGAEAEHRALRSWADGIKVDLAALQADLSTTEAALADAERKEQLWRAEWQQITDTAERLQAALAESRGENDALKQVALKVARSIREWDMLMLDDEGRGRSIGDAPWMRALGEELEAAALSEEAESRGEVEALRQKLTGLDEAAIEHAAKTELELAGGTWDDGSPLCRSDAHKRYQEQRRQKARSFVAPYLQEISR